MKLISLIMCGALVLSAPAFAIEKLGSAEGPYEDQLQQYSSFYGELLDEKTKDHDARRERNEQLRMTEMVLQEEYNDLQTGIDTKEESIERLKSLNTKLQKAQSQMYSQYSELEDLFAKQKEENERLKKELEMSRTEFYGKMVDFFQEEYELLGEKITAMQKRKEDIGTRLEQMKDGLAGDLSSDADNMMSDDMWEE